MDSRAYYLVEDGEEVDNLFEVVDVPPPRDSPPRKKQKNYRKKVETSWSHENILKLIQEVESRRSLWDVGCVEYKLHKDSVWQEVADSIPATFNDCKAKWCNLRTSFMCNLEKFRRRKSGQGTDESVPIIWKYFKQMMFLESNKLRQSTQTTSSMIMESVTTDESILNDLSHELSSLSPSLPGQQRKRKSSTPSSLPSSSSKRSNDLKDMAVQALQSMSCKETQPKDSSTVFGEYIASELRGLSPEQATFARSKMRRAFNDIMDEALLLAPQEFCDVLYSSTD